MGFTTKIDVLAGVKKNDDGAWKDFYEMYAPLIRLHGQDCGVPENFLDDLVQNVMVTLFRKKDTFEYNPEHGRFRDYLRKVIRSRAFDYLRMTQRSGRNNNAVYEMTGETEDPLNEQFEREWREHILKTGLARLKKRTTPRHYQIFELCFQKNMKPAEAAKLFQMPENTVYSIRTRLLAEFKKETALLEKN